MDPLRITTRIIAVILITNKVISICYSYSSTVKNALWELPRVINEISSLRNVLEILVQLAMKAENADSVAETRLPALKLLAEPQEGPLIKCLADLEALKQKLASPDGQEKSKRKNLIGALVWPLNEKDTQKLLVNIERFRTTLNLAITADQT